MKYTDDEIGVWKHCYPKLKSLLKINDTNINISTAQELLTSIQINAKQNSIEFNKKDPKSNTKNKSALNRKQKAAALTKKSYMSLENFYEIICFNFFKLRLLIFPLFNLYLAILSVINLI